MRLSRAEFIDAIQQYGVDSSGVWEAISETGKVVWHNNQVSLRIVTNSSGCLRASIVRKVGEDEHRFYEVDLHSIDVADFAQLPSQLASHAWNLRSEHNVDSQLIEICGLSGKEYVFREVSH